MVNRITRIAVTSLRKNDVFQQNRVFIPVDGDHGRSKGGSS